MDLQHPQYAKDRQLLSELLTRIEEQPVADWVLAEIARLRIRYMGFPGARDMQQDLNSTLERWQMSEAELFTRTRLIHQRLDVYRESFSNRDDWA
jgi:hypothetical protein